MRSKSIYRNKKTQSLFKLKKIGERIILIPVFDILNSKAEVVCLDEFLKLYEKMEEVKV